MAIDVKERIGVSEDVLADFCKRWKITELAVFGSALRDDFGPESDIDFLVTFGPDAEWSLFDHVDMERELGELLERPVDIVTRPSIEFNQNPLRKRAILGSARVIYDS